MQDNLLKSQHHHELHIMSPLHHELLTTAKDLAGDTATFDNNHLGWINLAREFTSWPHKKTLATLFNYAPCETVIATTMFLHFTLRLWIPYRHVKWPYSATQLALRTPYLKSGKTPGFSKLFLVGFFSILVMNRDRRIARKSYPIY